MKKILLAGAALSCMIMPAFAKEGDLLSFSLGYFDAFDDDGALDMRLEYRPNSVVFIDNLKPWAGIELTSDSSVWLGGGLLYDWNFRDNWYLTPSVGAGLYAQGSSDKDLGSALEFRTQLEISYEFEDTSRMAFSVSHISNAGLSDNNPGTEVFGVYWHVPLDSLF